MKSARAPPTADARYYHCFDIPSLVLLASPETCTTSSSSSVATRVALVASMYLQRATLEKYYNVAYKNIVELATIHYNILARLITLLSRISHTELQPCGIYVARNRCRSAGTSLGQLPLPRVYRLKRRASAENWFVCSGNILYLMRIHGCRRFSEGDLLGSCVYDGRILIRCFWKNCRRLYALFGAFGCMGIALALRVLAGHASEDVKVYSHSK